MFQDETQEPVLFDSSWTRHSRPKVNGRLHNLFFAQEGGVEDIFLPAKL
jgi:hypothetical protein